MGIRARVRKVVAWGTLLVLAALVACIIFGYCYITDSETLAALIQGQAPRFLPGSRVRVGKAQVRPFVGDATVQHATLWQALDGVEFQAVRLPYVHLRHDSAALWEGRYEAREVVLVQPTLRLRRRRDGTWNLQGLLADPWPVPTPAVPPRVTVEAGTVELVEGDGPGVPILRDVALDVEPQPGGRLRFFGSAHGDQFDRLHLEGTLDPATGRLALAGDLFRLAISDTLRERLPAEVRPLWANFGPSAGKVDLALKELTYDPAARPPLHYAASAVLREGAWDARPYLPFPLAGVTGAVRVKDGRVTVEPIVGHDGKTTVRAQGTLSADDPINGPLDLRLDITDLDLDERVRDWAPPGVPPFCRQLWREYSPRGQVNLAVRAIRPRPGGPVGLAAGVVCRDVAVQFIHFPYPLDHVNGMITWQGGQLGPGPAFDPGRLGLDLRTLIGGKPATLTASVEDPGPLAHAKLTIRAEALPVDRTLLDALAPDVRAVVDQFQPSGTVCLEEASVERLPPTPEDPRPDKVNIDAAILLREEGRCSIRWHDLPYLVSDLTGRLELHPGLWTFRDMKGRNGWAEITGSGRVEEVGIGTGKLRGDLHLTGRHLSFDQQLRAALPREWQASWDVLNPSGSSTVDARIQFEPGTESTHLVVVPDPKAQVRLSFVPAPTPGVAPGTTLVLPPMEDIAGTFDFRDGLVTMDDVRFQFRGSPVRFAHGTVALQDSGAFRLAVKDLRVADFRLDSGLRGLMPPMMAQAARRLDDGRPLSFRTDLGLGWSGRPGEPARCWWSDALVVLNGNSIQADVPLEGLQGQLDGLRGHFDGRALEVHGRLNLESAFILGQQLTRLVGTLDVGRDPATGRDRAALTGLSGRLLDGALTGAVAVDLAATPRYAAQLALSDADLRRYTETVPGPQRLHGLVSGEIALEGTGYDLRSVQGAGSARIAHGDLGKLPVLLSLVKPLNRARISRTAFDAADVAFRIHDGETRFTRIKLTGDAFSLRGEGTMSVRGELDLVLNILAGRNDWRLPILRDALPEATGQLLRVRVRGTPADPQPHIDPLHPAGVAARSLGRTLTGSRPPERR